MPDEPGMNITQHIPASLILGSVLVASASPVLAEGQGVGSVELIPFPADSEGHIGNLYFSDDGGVLGLHVYPADRSDIYQYKDGEWAVVRREFQTIVPGYVSYGISGDGERMAMGDLVRLDVHQGATVFTMPNQWTFNEVRNGRLHEQTVYGVLRGNEFGRGISGDGEVITMSGKESYQSTRSDSLAWFGGEELVNLSANLDRENTTYGGGLPNEDGRVIVFNGTEFPREPDLRQRVMYRWEDGDLMEIPGLDIFENGESSVAAISADGNTVFGYTEGPRRGSSIYTNLEEWVPWSTVGHGRQRVSWLWTEAGGTHAIMDYDRFLETDVFSVNSDGSLALLYARPRGSNEASQYLWMGDQNFVSIDDLFHSLGISIPVDWFSFREISNDGRILMGIAGINWEFHAIIVTIPDLTP